MSSSSPLDLALIGNGRIAAFITTDGRIVWWCFPRFDGDPVFCRLLSGAEEKGFTDIVLEKQVRCACAYERNTAIAVTTLEDADGGVVRITDFAPRFRQFDRIFHPAEIVRIVEPIAGYPRITIRARPTFAYGRPAQFRTLGSSHIRYTGGNEAMRLTTDGPLSYIAEEAPFVLTRPVALLFGSDESFTSSISSTALGFLQDTRAYWREWVRALAIPLEWQQAVIRAAITLKLCSFDETGAIVAAHTTSIPESPNSGRNWDYRYCWLRDAHFVVQALNRLGATKTMVSYLDYITNLPSKDGTLKPLYGIVPQMPLDERVASDLAGFEGQGPVRLGNAAADQAQHDAYGSIVLASQQMFLDERLYRMGDAHLFKRLEKMAEQAYALALEPDSGIWEYRGRQRVHTHSAAMCWAACDRVSRIATHLGLKEPAELWSQRAQPLGREITASAWSDRQKAFTAAFGSEDLDGSVLLLPELGLVRADDPRFLSTLKAIQRELSRGSYLMRYAAPDDFGEPHNAFLICSFWYIDALAAVGRKDEAREHFTDVLACRNAHGLLSEDIDPATGRLWGNIPQTYSMAGLVISAMRLSRSWEEPWLPASS